MTDAEQFNLVSFFRAVAALPGADVALSQLCLRAGIFAASTNADQEAWRMLAITAMRNVAEANPQLAADTLLAALKKG